MPAVERLSGWDFATWRSASDDPALRSTMIGLLILEKSPDWDRLVERYDRASRTQLILRKRVVEGPVAIANPRLVIDPNFDLSFHMRRFTAAEGTTWADVLDECRRQSMTDFDRDRPLWRVTVLEGLPGGKAAVISKLHHAIADGQGALQLGAALVDVSPEGFDLGPMPPAPESVTLTPRHFAEIMVHDNAEWLVNTARDVVKSAIPTLIDALTAPQETVEKLSETVSSLARFANTPTSPLSPVMHKRSINYHFATFDMRFRDLRDGVKAQGHTVNDGFLAAISLGLREYHKKLGAPVAELHLNMPISTRGGSADAQNAVSIARFDLPTNFTDVNKLMDNLGQTVRKMRAEPALEYANQLGEISRFLPKELLTQAAQASDVTASNVPGPPVTVYLSGAKVEAMVPLPPPIGAAVFVALLTYAGQATVGVAMDDAAITDRELLMSCLRDGFAKIIGKPVSDANPFTPVASGTAPRTKRAPAKKAPAKKAPAKKAPVKKAPVKKAPVKKAPAKKAPAKKAPVKKAPVKKAPVKKATSAKRS
ncbi:MAG: wax ester/triacylglycerol synthase domain-containing protein [Candidatus Nanopelagicales bacterium]